MHEEPRAQSGVVYDCWRSWYCQRVPLACASGSPAALLGTGVILGGMKIIIMVYLHYSKRVAHPVITGAHPPHVHESSSATGACRNPSTARVRSRVTAADMCVARLVHGVLDMGCWTRGVGHVRSVLVYYSGENTLHSLSATIQNPRTLGPPPN